MITNKKIALISTRPHSKNKILLDEFKNSNIKFLSFPLIQINAVRNYTKFDKELKNLTNYQHIIFISTNAVKYFIRRIQIKNIKLPKNIILSTIGPTTKKALQDFFDHDVHCPLKIYDSENLIKINIFKKIKNQKILIVRGVGGREVLKSKLEKKGAEISYAECYQRSYLNLNFDYISNKIGNIEQIFFLITSFESAKFLKKNIANQKVSWLNSISCIVNHHRIKKEVSSIFSKVIVLKDVNYKKLKEILV